MMTGRVAAISMSAALRTPSGSAPQRHEMLEFQSSGSGVGSGIGSLKISNGTSSTTGPGRPVTMVFHACRTAIGNCAAVVG